MCTKSVFAGLYPGPRWESLQCSPNLVVGWGEGCSLPIPDIDAFRLSIWAPSALRFVSPTPIQIPGNATTCYATPIKKFSPHHCLVVATTERYTCVLVTITIMCMHRYVTDNTLQRNEKSINSPVKFCCFNVTDAVRFTR